MEEEGEVEEGVGGRGEQRGRRKGGEEGRKNSKVKEGRRVGGGIVRLEYSLERREEKEGGATDQYICLIGVFLSLT